MNAKRSEMNSVRSCKIVEYSLFIKCHFKNSYRSYLPELLTGQFNVCLKTEMYTTFTNYVYLHWKTLSRKYTYRTNSSLRVEWHFNKYLISEIIIIFGGNSRRTWWNVDVLKKRIRFTRKFNISFWYRHSLISFHFIT